MYTDWSGWAGQILECLGDTTTTTGSVVCFLQTRLGVLNAHLGTTYVISGDNDEYIEPDMTNVESGILNEMYICYSYKKKINENLQASGCEVTSIEDPDGGKIKIVSGTEKLKVLRGLEKDCCECLGELINWYKKRKPSLPKQTLYNYRVGNSHGVICPFICPPDGYYSAFNFAFNEQS